MTTSLRHSLVAIAMSVAVAAPNSVYGQDEEPPLPAGLGDDEPTLPTGLGDKEPKLPTGLGDDAADDKTKREAKSFSLPFKWRMFADVRAGVRTQKDPYEDKFPLAEARLQLDLSKSWETLSTTARLAADFVYDPVAGRYEPDVETGAGAIDLRAANVVTSPTSFVDVKVGRQVLTWGTGDLLFINDLFPKDWTAFLVGRDIEYLKAPSDALRVGAFSKLVNADVVFSPRFDSDRLPRRTRISSWEPSLGRIAGEDAPISAAPPDRWISESELAARLYRNVGGYELAAYGYYGYWKSPAGFNPSTGAATFPALGVYGASARGPLLRGIASAEVGYYDSRDDRGGEAPLVRNSELRALVGFERELSKGVTGGLQYYVEHAVEERTRHVVTARLRWLLAAQALQVSVFVFASPSDKDVYVRPNVRYKVNDQWRAEVGANVFTGVDDHTFFGQLRNNTNVYAAVRYAR